jgi:hypothetical protein
MYCDRIVRIALLSLSILSVLHAAGWDSSPYQPFSDRHWLKRQRLTTGTSPVVAECAEFVIV